MTSGPHAHAGDPRNESVLVYVNGDLVPKPRARVSVFDSGFLMGDGVWEGLRLYEGRVPYLDAHLDRLFEGAQAIDLDIGRTREELVRAVEATVRATLVITAEWKEPSPEVVARGLDLVTVHVRRGRTDVQDPAWNSHSKLNCVTACIQAEVAELCPPG